MKVSANNQYQPLQSFTPADDLLQVSSTSPREKSITSASSSSPCHRNPHHYSHPHRNHCTSTQIPAMFLFLRRYPLYVFIAVQFAFAILYLTHSTLNPTCSNDKQYDWITPEKFVSSQDGTKMVPYDRQLPIIFIGGMPRSGTTLLRVLLDSHPMIRCGEETRLIPRILSYRQTWTKVRFESERLKQAGITSEVLDSAISSFILEIIVKHGRPAPRLCNKDPFTIRSAVYLNGLFPKSKFIFMIRDGRAVVHSIMTRKVTISGFDLNDFRQCLTKWNAAMESMNKQCKELGPSICLPVIYEDVVLHPKRSMERILKFLDVPWNDTVLHHEHVIAKGQISLSKLERSTDQVIKPINMEALSKWVGHIPRDVSEGIEKIAPMLSVFGYDTNCDAANYGTPDKELVDKINSQTSEEKKKWSEAEELAIKTREKFIEQIRAKNDKKKDNEDPHPVVN